MTDDLVARPVFPERDSDLRRFLAPRRAERNDCKGLGANAGPGQFCRIPDLPVLKAKDPQSAIAAYMPKLPRGPAAETALTSSQCSRTHTPEDEHDVGLYFALEHERLRQVVERAKGPEEAVFRRMSSEA